MGGVKSSQLSFLRIRGRIIQACKAAQQMFGTYSSKKASVLEAKIKAGGREWH